MALEDVVKAHSDAIKDSTLCGMSRDEFYKAMVSLVFPGYTIFYAEDEKYNNELNYLPDDRASMLYSARVSGVKRTYYIGNGLSEAITIPEFTFATDIQKSIDNFYGIEGVSYRPYRKHPLYVRAEILARIITAVDEFTRLASHGICRPYKTIDYLAPWLRYNHETFSNLAITVIKWLTAHLSIEHRNTFVDYLAKDEHYNEPYVELVQFIHEYLTEQDNTAKFEL